MSNHLGHRAINELKGTDAGKAFENFIFMELGAAISYKNLNLAITYWRTKSGLEVDFIIGSENPIACEVKIKNRIDKADIKGLLAFAEEAPTKRLILVCLEPAARIMVHNDVKVEILPWQNFFAGY